MTEKYDPLTDDRSRALVGKMVEIHLLNGKRFLGKVRGQDDHGLTIYCIPLRVLETMPEGAKIQEQLADILHTLFFPWVNVEYVDIGGEPVGFDTLFADWFDHQPLEQFFEYGEE